MPTYEYVCKSCDEHLEVVQSFKDASLTECPACQGQLRKVFGNIGITFKGSGFYKNDSRSPSKTGSSSTSSSSDSSTKDTSSSSSSSKDGAASTPAKESTSSASTSSSSASAAAS